MDVINKKEKVLDNISFDETIGFIKEFLLPIIDAIENDISFNYMWLKDKNIWK